MANYYNDDIDRLLQEEEALKNVQPDQSSQFLTPSPLPAEFNPFGQTKAFGPEDLLVANPESKSIPVPVFQPPVPSKSKKQQNIETPSPIKKEEKKKSVEVGENTKKQLDNAISERAEVKLDKPKDVTFYENLMTEISKLKKGAPATKATEEMLQKAKEEQDKGEMYSGIASAFNTLLASGVSRAGGKLDENKVVQDVLKKQFGKPMEEYKLAAAKDEKNKLALKEDINQAVTMGKMAKEDALTDLKTKIAQKDLTKSDIDLTTAQEEGNPNSAISNIAKLQALKENPGIPKDVILNASAREIKNLGLIKGNEYQSAILDLRNKQWEVRKQEVEMKGIQEKRLGGQFDTKLRKDLTDKFNTLSKDSVKAIKQAQNASAVLNLDNPLTSPVLKRALARMAGESGVMTDKDVDSFSGSQAWADTVKRTFGQGFTGKMTEKDKQIARDLIKKMVVSEKKVLNSMAGDQAKAQSRATKQDEAELRDMFTSTYSGVAQESVAASMPEKQRSIYKEVQNRLEKDPNDQKALQVLEKLKKEGHL